MWALSYGDLDIFRQEIGNYLADRRRQLKLTQKQVADRMAVTQTTVSAIERGTYALSLSTLETIFSALDLKWGLVATPKEGS